ncbi:MAG: winged helix-turn-helix transcriptional regulator [Peptococcaceae bacterium]|nr:winged helix-turn-helix transcriptional regulator [Peptococcaceae bacterium]
MKTENKYENKARVFKALCDPNRLRIIEMLQSGERCACEILEDLQIGQSTLSHHMKILCDSGIVDGRKEGKWMYYSLNKDGCEAAKKLLDEITSQKENSNLGGRKCGC